MTPPVRSPFVREITVAADAIDAQGHVSNVKVLEWMNEAAIAHSTELGLDVARYQQIRGIFVVRRHELDYHASAFQGDELVLYTWPSERKRSTAERKHELYRKGDGVLIARGLNLWAYVDTETGRPKRMPPEVAEAFDPAQFV